MRRPTADDPPATINFRFVEFYDLSETHYSVGEEKLNFEWLCVVCFIAVQVTEMPLAFLQFCVFVEFVFFMGI